MSDPSAFEKQIFSRLDRMEEILQALASKKLEKEYYATQELATALGKAVFTITERYCNAGRIECQKDEASGKWMIPGHEYRRLVAGGALLPPKAK
jgi:hypothetical protein